MERRGARLDLPSGGWWEFATRPTWRQVGLWREGGPALVECALAGLTVAWSFPEPVDARSVSARRPGDLAEALAFVQDRVIAPLDAATPREMAESLFAGLVAGQLPDAFLESHVMAATGWDWNTLQETPADVVQRMAVYLAVRLARDTGAELDIPVRPPTDDEEVTKDEQR